MRAIKLADHFKKYSANLSIYFLASLVPMLLSLVSNPFIAKNMSPHDYAIVGYYSAFITLFTPFINFFFIHYYTKKFYELTEQDRVKLKATIFKSFLSLSFLMTLAAIIILFLYSFLANETTEIPFLPYALLAMLRVPLGCLYTLELMDFRMRRDSKRYFVFSVTNGILVTSSMLLFVVAFKLGALGNLTGALLATAIFFFIIIIRNKHLFAYPFDRQTVKEAVMFCWPIVIAAMLSFFGQGYDKIVLERAGDLTVLGYYSVGVSIAAYVNVFADSINSTFQPDVFENIVKRNFRKTYKIVALKLVMILFIVGCFIALAPFIIDILTFGRYVNSTKFAIIASLASVTSMLYYSLNQIVIALGYSSIILGNKIVGSMLSVLSFNFLISHFGATGAAWGLVVSFVYDFLIGLILVWYKYHKTSTKRIRT